MDIWVADELGQIKACSVEPSTDGKSHIVSETEVVLGTEQHDRTDYVQIMAHAKWPESDKITYGVAVARRGGSLEILDPATGEILWERRDERVEADDMFVALEEKHGRLFWCTNHGYYGFETLDVRTTLSSSPSPVGKQDQMAEWKLEGPISKARCHPHHVGVFAIGGKDMDLEIWGPSQSTAQATPTSFDAIWKAKNVRNDEYNLKQPIWISDLQFLEAQRRSEGLGYKLVVVTRFHQVRVYDTRFSRRPLFNIEVGSSPLVSLVLGSNDRFIRHSLRAYGSEVIFADSHGKVTSFSLEKRAVNGNFVGPTGSVLSLDVSISGRKRYLACVGLDRFLRLFDISTRESIGKVYCKTKMTSVLVIEGLPGAGGLSGKRKIEDTRINNAGTDANDSVWAKLPEVGSMSGAHLKRRRLRVSEALPTTV